MPIIMIIYYVITAYIVGMLIWNFIKEKKNFDDMILYLVILVPLVLRLLRVK
jgi:NhaP-type Na+/H+ or K+/H+ antiporter